MVGRRQPDAGRGDPADRVVQPDTRTAVGPGGDHPAQPLPGAGLGLGARLQRPAVDLGVVGSGAGVWLVAYTIPAVRETAEVYVTLNLAIAATFLFAAASNSGAAATTG